MSASAELKRLYDEHVQALHGFLLHFTRNDADACDLLQDLFCKLAARPELLDGLRDERAFLLRLAHNLAVDLIRQRSSLQKRYEGFAAESPDLFLPDSDHDDQALRQAVTDALGELPPEQRAVIHLKLWQDRTFEEIGEILGIPLKTAASRYRYGLEKLQQRLRPLYGELR